METIQLSDIPWDKVNEAYLVLVNLEDGCVLLMNPKNGDPRGWALRFPAGFEVACPHGHKARMD